MTPPPAIKRGVIQTTLGSIFYLLCDGRTNVGNNRDNHNADCNQNSTKLPILCFHMSPRSSDEYLEVLPLLAENKGGENGEFTGGRVVIALDAPGYGASENPTRSCTIDEVSDAFLEVADALLGSDSDFAVVGSLMGNFFCVSLASRYPDRVKAGIVSNPWYSPISTTSCKVETPPTVIEDSFVLHEDGSHLVELHDKRKNWLDPELNFRVVHSEMAYLVNRRKRYAEGISIQSASDFDFEASVRRCRTSSNFLCIQGRACAELFDKFGLEGTRRFEEACQFFVANHDNGDTSSNNDDGGVLPLVRVETLTGEKSTLNLVNQMPGEFAALCNSFMSERGL